GLKTIMVTNGTFSEEALVRIYRWIDAFNIDLKGDEDFYRKYCGGSSRPVWQSIEQITQEKVHLEVTTLVMEGVHTLEKLTAIGERLSSSGVQVWHLSRYFPHYKERRQATSEVYLEEAVKHARMLLLPFVYPGNSTLDQNTYCPYCKTRLVSRSGIGIDTRIIGGCCPKCGNPLYGHW
ncbi:MAG: radical SAM protein, partial [Sphaerochaetaceae bacterium]